MTLASVLAANEVNRQERSNWPWICLLILPLLTIITSTWFFIIVTVICGGSLLVALISRRYPENWVFVAMGAILRRSHGVAQRRQPDHEPPIRSSSPGPGLFFRAEFTPPGNL